MKIAALVQARMESTRLPGKVLMEVEGRPMLWHITDRLRRAGRLDQVIIVTTTSVADDAVKAFCERQGIDFFRGSQEDVLDRYYQAATHFKVDQIVRITGDCPLIDPEVVDAVIQKHLSSGSDYTSNTLKRTYPRGLDVEIFTFACLQAAYSQADQPFEREHVTPFIYQHAGEFIVKSFTNAEDLSCFRWTVDTEEDFKLVQAIYAALFRDKTIFTTKAVLDLLKKTPQLAMINAHVKQKTIKGES